MQMKTTKLLLFALATSGVSLISTGCVRSKYKAEMEGMNAEHKEGFELATRRCSKCHDFEELVSYHKKSTTISDWASLVDGMADISGSGITRTERPKIAEALFAWSQKSGK